jgi:hypothetical protein
MSEASKRRSARSKRRTAPMYEARASGQHAESRTVCGVKYVILIYQNPVSRAMWERLSADQRAAGWAAYAELNEELAASGELIASEALAEGITVHKGAPIASDGPFAEAKEHLAGFYLLECASLDRAVEIARRIPEAEHIDIEVRPVLTLSGAG